MTDAVLQLERLTVRYGSTVALDQVSAHWAGGSLGLLGPNGAGKSTLLRAVLGLVHADEGSIQVLGKDAGRGNVDILRHIGYMPERDCWVEGLSAVAGLAHLGEVSGIPPKSALVRAHDVLHFVGLAEERYREVSTFSVGMRQRYKLAIALVHDPDILLLDEPTNGLDPSGRTSMLELVDRIRKDHGIHVILASHLLPDVEQVCDRVWVLNHGILCRDDSLSNLTAAARGAKRVQFQEGDCAPFLEKARQAGLTAEEESGSVAVVSREEATVEPAEVFSLAKAAGLEVSGIRPAARSLEDAFLEALEAEK
jgi:ABC-2 type transport system ATP-binding protein